MYGRRTSRIKKIVRKWGVFMSAILKQKLIDIANGFTKYGLWKGSTEITVDSELSTTSTNPVQNKVITSALNGKSNTNHTHDDRYYTKTETNNLLNVIGSVVLLGQANANIDSTSVTINLSQSLDSFRFLYILANADSYLDSKLIPVKQLDTLSNINGRGYYLKVFANDSYYWESNVGFYTNKITAEVRTLKYSGWTGTIYIYGVR